MSTWADFGIEVPSGATGEVDTTCPQCSPSRKKQNAKCLSCNADDETFFCHHCGWSGSLGNGQATAADLDFFREDPKPKVYQPPRPIPEVVTPSLWQKAVAWFQTERGIPEAILLRNRVTVATEWCPVCEDRTSHVLFPYERGGVHVNTKHRCVRKHFRMEKGAERILWGLSDAAGADTWIWVEGEIDKLALEAVGFTNVVSVPDGAPAPDSKNYAGKFSFLESDETLINAARTHVIAVDADAPGQRLRDELIRRLGKEKCRVVSWPDGVKDANDALKKLAPWELVGMIEDAPPVKVDGIWTVADLSDELDDLYANGFDRGVSSGWVKFDNHYRTRAGLMTVVTGIPGHGKSHFLDHLMVKLAIIHGWTFAVCSPENQPIKRHAAGLMAKYLGKPFHSGPTPRMTPDEERSARSWLNDHFAFVLPEEPTVDAILDRVRVLVYRMGVKGVVLDPWNEIEHSRPDGMTETEYVSQCLGKLRRFARLHDVHLWVVAHPTKLKKEEGGKEPMPGLWEISGSANFRNKADAGLTVWRDTSDPSSPVEVHITKIRFAETGQLGRVDFGYDPVTGQYREVM